MLKITRNVIIELIEHAKHDTPLEACGYLGEMNGVITNIYRLKNMDASAEHYSFDPAEQFSVMRQMRAAKLKMKAVYHSHPASPARPSAEDIRLAYDPALFYVIVSLAQTEADVKAFVIRGGEVTPEPIEIVEI